MEGASVVRGNKIAANIPIIRQGNGRVGLRYSEKRGGWVAKTGVEQKKAAVTRESQPNRGSAGANPGAN